MRLLNPTRVTKPMTNHETGDFMVFPEAPIAEISC